MKEKPKKPTKVLFLAWGDSIHARRRISLFAEDLEFEVAVVSTYNYAFPSARNISLVQTQKKRLTNGTIWQLGAEKWRNFLIFLAARKIFKDSGMLAEVGGVLRLFPFIKSVFSTEKTRDELEQAIIDFQILRQSVEEFKPDVIFLQTLLYPCYLSNFLTRDIPIVITFWNGDVTWWAQWNGLERLFKKQMVEHGVRRAHAITVNSRTAYDVCLGYGVPDKKVHLIRYPGVDLNRFKPASRELARNKLGIDNAKVILCPRGLGGYLNSDVIIEAAVGVISRFPDLRVLFISGVGGDAEWQWHLRRAAELGISGHLRRDGQVPWEEMPLYYQAADVVVSISSNDSLPNCMLEAMACGVPLVMGDIPQIREWVTDGVNGLLVPPRDPSALARALLRLLGDDGTLISAFADYNLGLVEREFDGKPSSRAIKELVRDIAAGA